MPPRSLVDRLLFAAARPLERLLHVDRINAIYNAAVGAPDARAFLYRVLDYLDVHVKAAAKDLERIPKTGPLLIVSNHPFGALDGIILAAVVQSVRPDVRVMANYLLREIPELRELFIFVDPFENTGSAAANLGGMRQSLRWLAEDHALAAFPAGEVAHLDLATRQVRERPWNQTIARLAKKTAVPVLPVFFDGHNSALFHAAGLLHPRLRTAMLAREVSNKRGRRIEVRIGSLITAKKIESIESDVELTAHLRQRTLLLRHRPTPRRPRASETARKMRSAGEPIISAVDPEWLAAEIGALDASQRIVQADEFEVWHAEAKQIPQTLREVGRLREITFRATGEGTGKSVDLDEFDGEYLHLFVWNKQKREIVGAYRLGRVDRILARLGTAGLYTRTLFDFDQPLLDRLGTALEMGRSFVRAEYQRAYAPLLLLWKGIGAYCVQNPRYRTLFGPVSISNDYQTVSKQLLVRFLKANHCPSDADELVHPRRPFREKPLGGIDAGELTAAARGEDDVAQLIAEVEPDGKGIPVLLRQYLRLGAKLLAFNVDRSFNDAIDGLIVVDLTKTEPRILERYMGKPGYAAFMNSNRECSRQNPN
jgi:putative hemolysin